MWNKQRSAVGSRKSDIGSLQSDNGQTLVESLLAIAVAVIVVVVLVSIGITAMRTADFGKNQAEAVRSTSELLELLRSKRDAAGADFFSQSTPLGISDCDSTPYCCLDLTNTLTPSTDPTGDNNCRVNNSEVFHRYFYYTDLSPDSATIIATTSFVVGALQKDVNLKQVFTNWGN